MTQKIHDRHVSDEMAQDVRIIKRVGGRVFLVVGEKMAQGCSNCNGCGYLHLQTVVGGPYEYVPVSITDNKTHTVPTNINNQWYQVRVKGYQCPVCSGQQIVSEIDEKIQTGHLDALTSGMKVKNSYRQGQRQLEQKAKTHGYHVQ